MTIHCKWDDMMNLDKTGPRVNEITLDRLQTELETIIMEASITRVC